MTFLRMLNAQGAIGTVAAILLLLLFASAKIESRYWRKQSSQFEQLYRAEAMAHQLTELAVRRSSEEARRLDAANAARVRADQHAIDERTLDDFEVRLADARDRASRMRAVGSSGANSGDRRNATVSGFPASAGATASTTGEGGLPAQDALIATEQAIQLDALIRWVRAQSAVEVSGHP